jgi:hypothetical protein
MAANKPTLHGQAVTLGDLIQGDIVATHAGSTEEPSVIVGTVDTVGSRFVNVVARDGAHCAYPADALDRVG